MVATNEYERYTDTEMISVEQANQNLQKLKEKHALEVENLIEKNKKLIAVIGHDVRTPIGAIIGFLANLKEKHNEFDKNKIESYLDIALISARRSLLLFDNLLEWVLAENTIKSFRQENVDLSDMLLEETGNVTLFASQKQIKIKTDNLLKEKVFIDKNMIGSVLRNLLNNAIKYTSKNGEISISAKKCDEFAEISIKDNGMGIKKELQDIIFTTNAFTSALGTEYESGSGFGLLLCKEFIDFHGGKIWIISEPGNGSEFKFTLPISTLK